MSTVININRKKARQMLEHYEGMTPEEQAISKAAADWHTTRYSGYGNDISLKNGLIVKAPDGHDYVVLYSGDVSSIRAKGDLKILDKLDKSDFHHTPVVIFRLYKNGKLRRLKEYMYWWFVPTQKLTSNELING